MFLTKFKNREKKKLTAIIIKITQTYITQKGKLLAVQH